MAPYTFLGAAVPGKKVFVGGKGALMVVAGLVVGYQW